MRLLQLVQRRAGIARRKAQRLIEQGEVRLDGQTLTNPFLEVDPETVRELEVRGRRVPLEPREPAVYKLYKPAGMLSSLYDPKHPNTVGRLLQRRGLGGQGLAIAGRLDRDAEGLLLLTNDGELVNLLTHPRYEVEKVYHVVIPRLLPYRHVYEMFRKMQRGVRDGGEVLRIRRGRIVERSRNRTVLELVLTEGKKHEVKRLIKHFKLPLERLVRVGHGPVALGKLRPGELKRLTTPERRALEALKKRLGSPSSGAR